MKRYLLNIFTAAAVAIALSLNGCITDAFDTLTQNFPITQEFSINGGILTTYNQTETIDLSSSTTFKRYQDKLQSIKFARAEFRSKNVAPANLSAVVSFTLTDANNNLLFSVSLGKINLADYETTPYELTLTSQQIALVNSYLSNRGNQKFLATLSISNVSPVPYTLDGIIDVAFEMKTKL